MKKKDFKSIGRAVARVVIVLLTPLFCSCNPLALNDAKYHKANQINLGSKLKGGNYSIVIIHSYNEMGQEGRYFRNIMYHAYKRHGVKVRTHHIYLDLIHTDNPVFRGPAGNVTLASSVFSYNPDIILINDDLAFNYVMEHADTLVRTVPSVFAGVSVPSFNRFEYPLLTGLRDPADLATNCSLVKNLYGLKDVLVEIDYGGYQDVIRNQMRRNISDSALYVDNTPFRKALMSDAVTPDNDDDTRVTVAFASMADPESNRPSGSDASSGLDITQRIKAYSSSGRLGHIQVKYDIFSNSFLDLDSKPQVTAIREQFSNYSSSNNESRGDRSSDFKRTKFLCGYFASIETQIVDQVHYSLRILQGENPSEIPVDMHQKEFIMDWNAMKLMDPPLEYSAVKDQFVVVNAPFHVTHRTFFCLIIGFSVLLLFFIIFLIVSIGYGNRNKARTEMFARLQEESQKRLLVLEGSDSVFLTISDGKLSFLRNAGSDSGRNSWPLQRFKELFVDPNSFDSFDVCTNISESDVQKSKVRVRASFLDRGWHWWEMTFRKFDDRDLVTGFAVNIDKTVEYENTLRESARRAEEVTSKENFIANITHDIRTPLNAISGFAQLLAEDCTFEERSMYSNLIKDNTAQLLNLIDEAVRKPSDSVDSMSFKMREISAAKLMNDSYQTNRILCPLHLKFIYEPYQGPDVTIQADSVRTTQVINNFLSNAFKYTLAGSVTFGWTVIAQDKCIEVYVSDTGIGISEEDKKVVKQRFGMAKGNYNGTGLGLDICRTVIEKQNGQYGFTSRQGEGSRFWFRLPLYEMQTEA